MSARPYGTGDDGSTWLLEGRRVRKYDLRVICCGEVDELNSLLGVCRAFVRESHAEIDELLRGVQSVLFTVGAELAAEDPKSLGINVVTEADVKALERALDSYLDMLEPLKHFIYPSGSVAGSLLHLARSVTRRAERHIVMLSDRERINPQIIRYLNRLSTLLFHLARFVNVRDGRREDVWLGRGYG
ncbi:MAG: cob(I)yrinic acid a,c-diamide adenosyltransferase [Aigarchaeota archaeon]|nr:cob(I)yrinic acid a,c-diamide adenosyltransferase [Aigarchaeota archaeon]MCS7117989.1 cob(I)yrinic acid a,c-diamide adenosyltransferase [Candidatus Calditenuaceae archaeon]MDW8041879.1 cob(I)yrinic acid a,c-diamide adenosyltransferase [Nitrososphaerota archaeon]